MDINEQAPYVSRNEIYIKAPPNAVWQLLSDINNWSAWQQGVTRARLAGPLAGGSVFAWKTGGLSITSTLQEVEIGRRIGWTGKALGTRAVDIWRLQPQDAGTLVETEESLEGWMASLLKLVMPGFLNKQKTAALEDLKRAAETESLSS